MHRLLLLLLTIISASPLLAQSHWQTLPDTGRALHASPRLRYEDVYFTDSLTGYAVSFNGFIFKTTDAGRHWSGKFMRLESVGIRSIEFLDDKRTGIAGCLDPNAPVYRTTDAGASWADISANLKDTLQDSTPKNVCGIAHFGTNFYLVGAWFSAQARVYKSTDGGLTWQTIYLDRSLINGAVDACFISADTGFVTGGYSADGNHKHATASVVLKTTDGGKSWKRVFADSSVGGRIWKIQSVSPRLLVGSIEPFFRDTVAMIRSTDGGDTWQMLGTGFHESSSLGRTQGIGFANETHGWMGGWYAGSFETYDGGLSWNRLGFGTNMNRYFVLDSTHVFNGGLDIYFYGGALPTPDATAVKPLPSILPHKLCPVTPNPARGIAKIEFDLSRNTYVLLEIASIDTRQSWQIESRWLSKGHHVYYWNANGASPGNYLVWLGTNEIPIVEKFVLAQ